MARKTLEFPQGVTLGYPASLEKAFTHRGEQLVIDLGPAVGELVLTPFVEAAEALPTALTAPEATTNARASTPPTGAHEGLDVFEGGPKEDPAAARAPAASEGRVSTFTTATAPEPNQPPGGREADAAPTPAAASPALERPLDRDPLEDPGASAAPESKKPLAPTVIRVNAVSEGPHALPSPTLPPEQQQKENLPAAKQPQQEEQGAGGPGPKRTSRGAARAASKRQRKSEPGSVSNGASVRWVRLEAGGPEGIPAARWGSTLTAVGPNKLILVAGSGEEEQLGDAWQLEVGAGAGAGPEAGVGPATWQRLPPCPTPRSWHGTALLRTPTGKRLVAYGGERVIFKGTSPGHGDDDSDLDEVTEVVEPVMLATDGGEHVWMPLVNINPPPECRSGSCVIPLGDGRAFVWGGIDANGTFKNTAFLLDVEKLVSIALEKSGAPPKARAYANATLVRGRIVVFGGMGQRAWSFKEVYSLTLNSWKWTEHTPNVDGDVPTPRSGAATVALPDDRSILVFGGGDAPHDKFFSDVHILDTVTWKWQRLEFKGPDVPRGRGGHTLVALEGPPGDPLRFVTHGGRSNDGVLCDDLWALELCEGPLC